MSVYKGWPDKVVIEAREKQIKSLEAQNAELKKKLEEAMETPDSFDPAISAERYHIWCKHHQKVSEMDAGKLHKAEKKLEDFIKHHEKMCWDYTDRLNETHMKLEVAKDALKDARWAARVVIVFCNVLKKLDGNCRPFQKQKAEMILAKHKDKIELNENNKQGER